MRLDGVRALSLVTEAVLLKQEASEFIRDLKPDFVVKGKEFENRYNREAEIVAQYGGKLIFSSGEMRFASMELLDREFNEPQFSSIRKPAGFAERHGFATPDLHELLRSFRELRVTVIGDVIVDDYITCDPLGMSQEDPTIVVTPIETKSFVGGAGVVAAHSYNLGARTRFFSLFGKDGTADYACRNLTEMGVEVHAFPDETRPTPRKQRFRAHGKTLLRVNHLKQHAASEDIGNALIKQVEATLSDTDVIMFADFNYGTLPQWLVDEISDMAKSKGVTITADSQASSQMSDISRFRGMTLVTPTEREARLALQDSDSGLAFLAEKLREKSDAENVLITLGGEGMLIHGTDKDGVSKTDRLPAMNKSPKDVAGAGDSLFTIASLSLCAGADIWRSSYLGAIAAACQVSRVGNSPLNVQDIQFELNQPDAE